MSEDTNAGQEQAATDEQLEAQLEANAPPPVEKPAAGNLDKGLQSAQRTISELRRQQTEASQRQQQFEQKIDGVLSSLNEKLGQIGSKPLNQQQQDDLMADLQGLKDDEFPTVGQLTKVAQKLANRKTGTTPEQIAEIVGQVVNKQLAPLTQKLQAAEAQAADASRRAYWAQWSRDHPEINEEERNTLFAKAVETAEADGYADASERNGMVKQEFKRLTRVAEARKAEGKKSLTPREQGRTSTAPPSSTVGTATRKPGATSADGGNQRKSEAELLNDLPEDGLSLISQ